MSSSKWSGGGQTASADDAALDHLLGEVEIDFTESTTAPPAHKEVAVSLASRSRVPAPVLEADPADQRDARRLAPGEVAAEVKLTVRGASDVKTINVSESGALAETTSRLRPGSVVEVVLTIGSVRQMMRATIVRSTVHSLNPTTFRTAFKFEDRTTLPER
jgi:hypothetical protein